MEAQSQNKKNKDLLPSIQLPKGGGAINNIGEKFSVNTVTGTGSATIPIPISAGRNGFTPQLGLTYDSGSGNSSFGLGWNVGISSIVRKTAKGLPKYQDDEESDVFVFSGAEDLVPFLDKENDWNRKTNSETNANYTISYYRPRTEGSFAKIEKWASKTNLTDVYWKTTSNENTTNFYGKTKDSRIVNPKNESQVFEWLLDESRDNRGNLIQYEYRKENTDHIDESSPSEQNRLENNDAFNQRYLKRVLYGNTQANKASNWLFQVVFDYGEHELENPKPFDYEDSSNKWNLRQDPFSTYRAGFEIRTYRLCKRILLFHQFEELNNGEITLVRSTDLTYNEDTVASTLINARQVGYIKTSKGYSKKQTPPLLFNYSKPHFGQNVCCVSKKNLVNVPAGLAGSYQFVDLEGEGLAGILIEKDNGWFYKSNEGNGNFGSTNSLKSIPSLIGNETPQLQDLDGDGNKELVIINEYLGGFYNYKDSKWENYTPFKSLPNINWQNPNLRFLDLNGDGYADILITEDDVLRWFPSAAKGGYGLSKTVLKEKNEKNGPTLVFSDASETVYLADMSGDGLIDLVRLRNKDIAYWPNLGYGKFGAKITMDNAPLFDHPDHFNQRNIRLADIDGTGTTDILYFNSKGASFWINQSGNNWGEVFKLDQFPAINQVVNVQLVDLLGNGTPCLTWSSPLPQDVKSPLKYIDLMEVSVDKPLGKPYLLNEINNSMGKIDRFQYAASTKFYLEDKKAGKPWITKLHFPVYVVEKVDTIDEISNSKLSISYSYHHGYFDPIEREFRGFGMVEQIDSESFDSFKFGNSDDGQQEHFVHPVLTKTWLHVGSYMQDEVISKRYQSEYFKETDIPNGEYAVENYLLKDSEVDLFKEAGFDTKREASRVLRGQVLRQEIYALDGSEKEEIPYTVTEANFIIKQIQPKSNERHGVFMVLPNESIVFNYERECCDPRVAHTLTLKTDEFGNALQSAEVVYPRRENNTALYPVQLKLYCTVSENKLLHQTDEDSNFYVLGIPVETKSFEVTGIQPEATYFSADELKTQINNSIAISFHVDPDAEKTEKRLLQWQRTYFWNEDQSEQLDFESVEWPILPHHAEEAVFTQDLIESAFGDKLTETDLTTKGAYVFHDNYWWNPGIITHFKYHDDPNMDDRNRANPFLFPVETQNPFEKPGNESKRARVFYDDSNLTATSADNQEGLTVSAMIDYRTLSPSKIVDLNENISEALTDELGMVIATTGYGTEENEDGVVFINGDLDIESYVRNNPNSIDQILDTPHRFLQGASAFFFYDLHAWYERKQPPQFISLIRETHTRLLDNITKTEIKISLGYSDGFGVELQEKIKVEAGIGLITNAQGELILDLDGNPKQEELTDRWLSSGRTILNNKQKPIKQYEPFYIDSPTYLKEDNLPKIGVTAVLHYDPLMRVIKTDTPDGFFSKIEFSSWESATYDLNDTVKDSPYYLEVKDGSIAASDDEKQALIKAEKHYNTPSKSIFDSLGRSFQMIEMDENGMEFITESTFNITGQVLTNTDPRQLELNQLPERDNSPIHNFEYFYDMQGNVLLTKSIDAGESCVFINAIGNPVNSWMPRGFKNSINYDELDRPIEIQVEGGDLASIVTTEKMVYANPNSPAHKNQRGQLVSDYDQVGKDEVLRIGFKGDVLESAKRFISIFENDLSGDLKSGLEDLYNWNVLSDADLENEVFTASSKINGLGQVLLAKSPDGSIHKPIFNHSGQLKKMAVQLKGNGDFEPVVSNIAYNEKGQRSSITYENGVKTTYAYHPKNYRLVHLKTSRKGTNELLQDLHYTYDPIGNISRIEDHTQQSIFFNNQVVEAINEYSYDAFYQIKSATGREHIGQTAFTSANDQVNPTHIIPHKSDGQKMRNYTRHFNYDKAGNMLLSEHKPCGATNFKRHFNYDLSSNKLTKSGIGQEVNWTTYDYDAAGNMQSMAHLSSLSWNHKNEIQQLDKTDLRAFYQYDGEGERARKIVGKGNSKVEVRYYIGDFEIYREYKNGKLLSERESLHLMDDTQRILMIDTQTVKDGNPIAAIKPIYRYQLGNHLGSASVELDEKASIISYEEFYPYGSSSYQAVDKTKEVARKRYRYTGMERDEESGLNYHSARYYAPWLCRWLKPDPAGTVDGLNVWRYVRGNPLLLKDTSGLASKFDWAFESQVVENFDDRMKGQSQFYVAKEVSIKVDIGGGVSVGGRVDRLVVHKESGKLYYREFKFDSSSGFTKNQKLYVKAIQNGGAQVTIVGKDINSILSKMPNYKLSYHVSQNYEIVTRWEVDGQVKRFGVTPSSPIISDINKTADGKIKTTKYKMEDGKKVKVGNTETRSMTKNEKNKYDQRNKRRVKKGKPLFNTRGFVTKGNLYMQGAIATGILTYQTIKSGKLTWNSVEDAAMALYPFQETLEARLQDKGFWEVSGAFISDLANITMIPAIIHALMNSPGGQGTLSGERLNLDTYNLSLGPGPGKQ